MGDHESAGRPRTSDESSAPAADDAIQFDAMRLALVARATENVTHEMNNVLMSLANYAEIAAMPHVAPPQRDAHLARISGLVDELAEQVRVLRSVVVEGGTEVARFDLDLAVRRAIAASRTGFRHGGVTVEVQSDAAPLPVLGPESEVVHALLAHLVAASAAVAAPPRAGVRPPHVKVTVGRTGDGRARVSLLAGAAASLGVVPSLRAFEPARSLAVRAGASASVDVDATAGVVDVQLLWPLHDDGSASR